MVKSHPKFSLILPTHNRADVLPCAIESVLAQTDQNFELLIVGDGCTDNTAEVVKPYLKDKRIQWFDLPKGPGFGYANRNVAFKQAQGKYIGLIAHDDILFPDHLETLGKCLDGSPSVDIVYSRPLWVGSDGTIMPSNFNLNGSRMLRQFMDEGNAVPASCFIHRASCFDQLGYWNDKLPEAADWDMYKRIIKAGHEKNFLFESTPTTLHFLASWRSKATFQEWPHAISAQFAKSSGLLPKKLKITSKKSTPFQVTCWAQIKNNPSSWCNTVRQASTELIDSVDQYALPKFAKLQKDWGTLLLQVTETTQLLNNQTQASERLQSQLNTKNQELNALQQSLSFKLQNRFFKIVKPHSFVHRTARWVAKIFTR